MSKSDAWSAPNQLSSGSPIAIPSGIVSNHPSHPSDLLTLRPIKRRMSKSDVLRLILASHALDLLILLQDGLRMSKSDASTAPHANSSHSSRPHPSDLLTLHRIQRRMSKSDVLQPILASHTSDLLILFRGGCRMSESSAARPHQSA